MPINAWRLRSSQTTQLGGQVGRNGRHAAAEIIVC